MALPLVTIGGTLCDAAIWQPVLAQMGCDALCVTAGCLADGTEAGASVMQDYASELLQTLPERFILAGFSLGGLIGLELLAQAPERVAGMAVVCAGGGVDSPEGAAQRRFDERRAAEIGMRRHASEMFVRFGATESLRDSYIEMTARQSLELYRRQNDLALSRQDRRAEVAALATPLALISAQGDPLCMPSRHSAWKTPAPRAQSIVLADAGHLLPLEQPQALAACLATWISGACAEFPGEDAPSNRRAPSLHQSRALTDAC